jgi:microsomal dipeptidase-like Zn-dependent dipeptidase
LAEPRFVDLHVHPDLPWVGAAWRRKVQGFRLESLDQPDARFPAPAARISEDGPAPSRIFGAAFYRTYLLRPARARREMFASLARFRRGLASGGGCLLEKRSDLDAYPGAPEAFFLCVESLRHLRDPADVLRLWDLGVRSLQPIHFLDTSWGGSSREGFLPAGRGGLTALGRAMLAEMAKPGMLLDLAHMNARTARECLDAYPGPIFCSHTGLSEVKRSARNVDGDLAGRIFLRGGIIGVTVWRHLLAADPSRSAWTRAFCATAHALAALAPEGRTRVGVGSDRGAPIQAPAWFFSPGHLHEIAAELGRLGWSDTEAGGFLGGNALDFLRRSLPDA